MIGQAALYGTPNLCVITIQGVHKHLTIETDIDITVQSQS